MRELLIVYLTYHRFKKWGGVCRHIDGCIYRAQIELWRSSGTKVMQLARCLIEYACQSRKVCSMLPPRFQAVTFNVTWKRFPLKPCSIMIIHNNSRKLHAHLIKSQNLTMPIIGIQCIKLQISNPKAKQTHRSRTQDNTNTSNDCLFYILEPHIAHQEFMCQ